MSTENINVVNGNAKGITPTMQLGFRGEKGDTGNTGAAAGFGTATASVDGGVGTPAVIVTTSGPDTAKEFDFAFSNLKGDKGDTGDAAGFGTVSATVDANHGTPAVSVTASGDDTAKNFAFAFSNLQPAPYDDSELQSDFATLQAQFDTAVAAVTVDSEVADIRVGADGVTYNSAGAAVRGQLTDLKSETKPLLMDSYDKADKVALATSAGTWRLDPDTGLSVSNANYMLVKFQVTAGDVLVVDCDDYFQFQTIASVPASGNSNRIGKTYGQGQYVVVVPIGATYLVGSSPTQTSTFAVYSTISKFDGQTEINNFVLNTLDNNYKYDAIPTTLNSGKLLYSSGQTGDIASTDWKVSDYVDVSDLTYIRIEASTGYSNLFYAKYTDNKAFISGKASGGEISSFAENVYVGDASYIRFSKFASNLGTVKEITGLNPRTWTGKKWVCIGDSLTEVNATATKRYYEYITDETGIQTSIYGVGGTGYANPNGTAGNFTARMGSIPTDADVYTIFGSFNDYEYSINNDIPIGNADDSGNSSLCGYFNSAFDALLTRVPIANLGVIAPCPWGGVNSVTGTTSKQFGDDYVDALKQCCERRSIPFLDLYHYSGMRPWDSAFREVVYTNNDNGTHPNEIGHKIMASKFKSFLETLLM